MADVSSEMRHVSPRDSSTASEASNGSLAKGPSYTFSACEPDEDPDFLSLIFPQKLWKVVESDQFKSISWDENGTSIMINEDLFKKEVLDRKAPFRIFETKSMKSFVRQLNLYGFNKMRQNFERSASLPDFLAEEEVVSTLSKILIYHNPNFKRGCPQLLKRMKRRVGIKSAPHVSTAFVPDFSEKHYQAGGNSVSHQNSGSVAETSGIGLFSASTNLNLPLIRKCSTSQRIDDTVAPLRTTVSPPLTSVRPRARAQTYQHTILNQRGTLHGRSNACRHTHVKHQVANAVTTSTSPTQYQVTSPTENCYLGRMTEPSIFPDGYPDRKDSQAPFLNQLSTDNSNLPLPTMADKSATSPSRLTHQPQ